VAAQLVASRAVLSFTELVSYLNVIHSEFLQNAEKGNAGDSQRLLIGSQPGQVPTNTLLRSPPPVS
jgi:hypothetical protein